MRIGFNESLIPHSALTTLDSIVTKQNIDRFYSTFVAQLVKNPPAMRDTWVRSLGWEDPLEKAMATHSSILAWEIPWTEESGGLQSMGSQRVRND